MAKISLTIAVIMAVLAAVLVGICTAINGIISLRFSPGSMKSRLLAISALSGFGLILAVVACIFGILYGRARSTGSKNARVLGIVFLIMAIVVAIMYVVIIVLTLITRNDSSLTTTDKNALTASLILTAAGFVSLTIATILFFTITKGKSGKSAKEALSFKKRGTNGYQKTEQGYDRFDESSNGVSQRSVRSDVLDVGI